MIVVGEQQVLFRTIQNIMDEAGLELSVIHPESTMLALVPQTHEPVGTWHIVLEAVPDGGRTRLRGMLWQGEERPRTWQVESSIPSGPITAVGLSTTRCSCRFDILEVTTPGAPSAR